MHVQAIYRYIYFLCQRNPSKLRNDSRQGKDLLKYVQKLREESGTWGSSWVWSTNQSLGWDPLKLGWWFEHVWTRTVFLQDLGYFGMLGSLTEFFCRDESPQPLSQRRYSVLFTKRVTGSYNHEPSWWFTIGVTIHGIIIQEPSHAPGCWRRRQPMLPCYDHCREGTTKAQPLLSMFEF